MHVHVPLLSQSIIDKTAVHVVRNVTNIISCWSTDHKSMYSQNCEFYLNHEKTLNPQYLCTGIAL